MADKYPYPYPYPYGVGRGVGRVRAVLRVINKLLEQELDEKDKKKLEELKKAISDKDYLPTQKDLDYINKLAKKMKVGVPYLYPLGKKYPYPYPYEKKSEFSEYQHECKFAEECPIQNFVEDEIPEEAFMCEYSIDYGCPVFFKEAEKEKHVSFKLDIFKVGTWHKQKYTIDDLKTIVNNFNKYNTKDSEDFEFVPRIKLTHKESGELSPAFGWVKKLWIENEKLMAEIVDVPEKLYGIIKKHFFDRSIELYINYQTTKGDKVGYVLKAVAFLGVDVPEVKGMTPLEEAETFIYNANQESVTIIINKEDDMLTELLLEKLEKAKFSEAEKKQLVDALNEQLQAKEQQFQAELKKKEEQIKNLASMVKEKTENLTLKEAEIFTEKAVANGNILPKQKDMVITILKSMSNLEDEVKFGEENMKPIEVFKKFVESIKQIDFEENSEDSGETSAEALIEKYKKEGLSTEEAIIKASQELNSDVL